MTETIVSPTAADGAHSALPRDYKLHWYQIKAVLGKGGFGITYLADDLNLQKQVAIKEYFPTEFAHRESGATVVPSTAEKQKTYQWGLDRFVAEARTLSKFDHPNIVKVHAVFEENGTGYMVMSYENGCSLQSMLDNGQTLDETTLLGIVKPLLDGLALVHKHNFIHRDIKPDNIFIRSDGTPVLLDFGSARQSLAGDATDMTVLVTPGYAPVEQYFSNSDEQGPWTDIYGLGATLYRAVTGELLTNAVERSQSQLNRSIDKQRAAKHMQQPDYSGQFLNALDHAIKVDAADRPRTVSSWLSELPDKALTPGSGTGRTDKQASSPRGLLLAGIAAIAGLAVAGYVYLAPFAETKNGSPAAPAAVNAKVVAAVHNEVAAAADDEAAATERPEQARLDLIAEQAAIAKQKNLYEIALAQNRAKQREQAAKQAKERELQLTAKVESSAKLVASRSATQPDAYKYRELNVTTDLAEVEEQTLTVPVYANISEWQDSGITLTRGTSYKIEASGSWKMAPSCKPSDATGEGIYGLLCFNLLGKTIDRYSAGALIAKIGKQTAGQDSLAFYIGNEFSFTPAADDRLFFRSNDISKWISDNTGKLAVTVSITD